MKNTILPPKSDWVFRAIFSNPANSDLLVSFLQSVLDLPADDCESIAIMDPYLRLEAEDDKLGILDVRLQLKSGDMIVIEVQVQPFAFMRERIIFYLSRMINEQISAGQGYGRIKRAVCVVITNYEFIPENDTYHNSYRLYDKNTGSLFSDTIGIETLELKKLPKAPDHTKLYDWMSFLRLEREEELDVLAEKGPEMQKVVGVLKRLSADEEARMQYEAHEKARRDHQARMEYVMQEGLAKGRAEGKAEGAETEAIRIAKEMLEEGAEIQFISRVTKLSEEALRKLRKG
jgi:predicted transposase/invertase (TIGR01784 family)